MFLVFVRFFFQISKRPNENEWPSSFRLDIPISSMSATVRAVKKISRPIPTRAPLVLTPSAVSRIQSLLDTNPEASAIKVGVRTRGCNGLSYTLDFAKGTLERGFLHSPIRNGDCCTCCGFMVKKRTSVYTNLLPISRKIQIRRRSHSRRREGVYRSKGAVDAAGNRDGLCGK